MSLYIYMSTYKKQDYYNKDIITPIQMGASLTDVTCTRLKTILVIIYLFFVALNYTTYYRLKMIAKIRKILEESSLVLGTFSIPKSDK